MRRDALRAAAAVAAAAVFAAALPGCGGGNEPERVLAFGTVTVDGARLPAGAVTLVPVDGTPGPRVVGTIADGEFDVPPAVGPVPGTYRVEIVADSPAAPPADAELSPAERARLRANPPARPTPLPAAAADGSLRRTLTAGPNRLDFDLTGGR